MKRAIIIVLDSVGVGATADAHLYGDVGANTLGNLARAESLQLPHLGALGLAQIPGSHMVPDPQAQGAFGRMNPASPGKDTTTGHWEIAGLRLEAPFPTFPDGFPRELMDAFETAIGTQTLGNYAASGTVIIDELGEEHLRTGYPIVYTSADSVFQIAANEAVIPVPRLYEMCEIARKLLVGPYGVGRVIARPFVGDRAGQFKRTGNRRDFSLDPTGLTILDALKAAGHEVLGVGKIEDIFNHRGLTGSNHAAGNAACIQATIDYLQKPFTGLCFTNLVDTDMVYGHRRDTRGYADALEAFDKRLPDIMALMGEEDMLLITADHGCDPTFRGTDHTREMVPLVAWRRGMQAPVDLGLRQTFADVAATVAEFFGLDERFQATSFLKEMEG
ncbi:MAG: phosphopentomutase [Clostridiales bacterium]|nr:phosphopentomutase [Clostridiales bacterium]